jgi:hypothetical protein
MEAYRNLSGSPGERTLSMSPPTIDELCRPRADVLEGRIRDEDFAADLSQVKRGQPKPIGERTKKRSRAQLNLDELLGEDDHYAVSPEDALDAARREGKAWRMEQLTSCSRRAQLDPLTEWFVLAWDAFEVPQFPYDEALRLARVVGLDLDKDVVGVLVEKKASDLILWDSSTRATKGSSVHPMAPNPGSMPSTTAPTAPAASTSTPPSSCSMATDWPTAPSSSRPLKPCSKCSPSPLVTPALIP